MEKEIVVELTEKEANAFEHIRCCKAACDQVVHSAIREWEVVSMAQSQLWSRLAMKYNLDLATNDYFLDADGKTIVKNDKMHRLERESKKARLYVDRILGEMADMTPTGEE